MLFGTQEMIIELACRKSQEPRTSCNEFGCYRNVFILSVFYVKVFVSIIFVILKGLVKRSRKTCYKKTNLNYVKTGIVSNR